MLTNVPLPVVVLFALFPVFFSPLVIALARRHTQGTLIVIFNVLFFEGIVVTICLFHEGSSAGIFGILWIVLLVWAINGSSLPRPLEEEEPLISKEELVILSNIAEKRKMGISMSDTDLQELAAAIRKKKGFADLERKASIAKETEAWPQLVFKDRADMEAFRDILREEKGSPEYNTALHQLTLTQMKEQGTAEDRKMAEEMEEAEQRMADFFTRALQEAKKEGRLK